MSRLLIIFLISLGSSLSVSAQIDEQAVRNEIAMLQGIDSLLMEFESFGVKGPGSSGLHNCGEWLASEYRSYGYTDVQFDTFDSPLSGINYNVLAYLPVAGAKSTIIVGSHYDTRGGPGTNDNGTGVAVQLLLAERLAITVPEVNILFVHFAGEEQGFHGSQHEANKWKDSSASLTMYYNLDQLGGTKGLADNMRVICERDEYPNPATNNAASASEVNEMVSNIEKYSSIKTSINRAYSSDYEPFQSLGFNIVGLYQHGPYDHEHTASDTLANVDTAVTLEIAKGFYAHLIVRYKILPILSVSEHTINLKVYPNPTSTQLRFSGPEIKGVWNYRIVAHNGKEVQVGRSTGTINLHDLSQGLYILRLHFGEVSINKRFVVGE